jgi:Ni,Fe-hydrogenase III large subunit
LAGDLLSARNPLCVELEAIPEYVAEGFSAAVSAALEKGGRLIGLFGYPKKTGKTGVIAAVALDSEGIIKLCRLAPSPSYPSLTVSHPEAHSLERSLYETWGVEPEGHPWLKPLRRIDLEVPAPGDASFYRVEGEEIHEVAVGPVHAGIIEPGHFRFQCHGETVFHLEIRLGYQHRGALGFLLGEGSPRWAAVAESITGDTAVGGATAHALCLEALCGVEVSPRAEAIRAIALELERIAYHVGDLGALGNDVGFLPTAQYNGRIRGDFLNCLLTLSGNRHGRGLVRPGGVLFGPEAATAAELQKRVEIHHREAKRSIDLLLDAPSVMARFDGTGRVSPEDARAIGLVGLAARASGLTLDARTDHPAGAFRFRQIPVSVGAHGDVHARALVRSLEMDRSAEFTLEALGALPEGPLTLPCASPRPNRFALALVEAWRGELVHAKVTDNLGKVIAADVVDPSVHNWFGLALCLRGQAISDFPLCNKSFNLAYAGHDL